MFTESQNRITRPALQNHQTRLIAKQKLSKGSIEMYFEAFFNSLLLILQLKEFFGPRQICLLSDVDDQSWKLLDFFGGKFAMTIKCERFVEFIQKGMNKLFF